MSYISLGGEETYAIFAGETLANLDGLGASQQEVVLSCVLNVLESNAPPSSHRREQIGNLDIYHAGSQVRIYAKAVDNIPRDNKTYHLLYVFFIDIDHAYPSKELTEYSSAAKAKLEEAIDLSTVDDVESYLEEQNALDKDDIRDLMP